MEWLYNYFLITLLYLSIHNVNGRSHGLTRHGICEDIEFGTLKIFDDSNLCGKFIACIGHVAVHYKCLNNAVYGNGTFDCLKCDESNVMQVYDDNEDDRVVKRAKEQWRKVVSKKTKGLTQKVNKPKFEIQINANGQSKIENFDPTSLVNSTFKNNLVTEKTESLLTTENYQSFEEPIDKDSDNEVQTLQSDYNLTESSDIDADNSRLNENTNDADELETTTKISSSDPRVIDFTTVSNLSSVTENTNLVEDNSEIINEENEYYHYENHDDKNKIKNSTTPEDLFLNNLLISEISENTSSESTSIDDLKSVITEDLKSDEINETSSTIENFDKNDEEVINMENNNNDDDNDDESSTNELSEEVSTGFDRYIGFRKVTTKSINHDENEANNHSISSESNETIKKIDSHPIEVSLTDESTQIPDINDSEISENEEEIEQKSENNSQSDDEEIVFEKSSTHDINDIESTIEYLDTTNKTSAHIVDDTSNESNSIRETSKPRNPNLKLNRNENEKDYGNEDISSEPSNEKIRSDELTDKDAFTTNEVKLLQRTSEFPDHKTDATCIAFRDDDDDDDEAWTTNSIPKKPTEEIHTSSVNHGNSLEQLVGSIPKITSIEPLNDDSNVNITEHQSITKSSYSTESHSLEIENLNDTTDIDNLSSTSYSHIEMDDEIEEKNTEDKMLKSEKIFMEFFETKTTHFKKLRKIKKSRIVSTTTAMTSFFMPID